MRAALAVLAAGDTLQAICHGAEGMHLQHLPFGCNLLFLWRPIFLSFLGDEALDQVPDLIENGDFLALQEAGDFIGDQQVVLCNEGYKGVEWLHKNYIFPMIHN